MNQWYSPGEVRHQVLQIPVQPFPMPAPGERYATVVIPDGISERDFGGGQHVSHIDSGVDIAKDLVRGMEGQGLFVAAGEKPTEEELKAAEDAMQAYFREQLTSGDSIWARSHDPRQITMHMRVAVKALGVKRDWGTDISRLVSCESCSELITPTAVKCPKCGAVRDWDAALDRGLVSVAEYDAVMARRAAKMTQEVGHMTTSVGQAESPKRPRGNPNWTKKTATAE